MLLDVFNYILEAESGKREIGVGRNLSIPTSQIIKDVGYTKYSAMERWQKIEIKSSIKPVLGL